MFCEFSGNNGRKLYLCYKLQITNCPEAAVGNSEKTMDLTGPSPLFSAMLQPSFHSSFSHSGACCDRTTHRTRHQSSSVYLSLFYKQVSLEKLAVFLSGEVVSPLLAQRLHTGNP
ncbi:hypothetical protein CHARACLAT_015015 [Characodon lateralis]|uniref:Uncharacterized protein n=1 Tax=Characodon lateralis TaxID=208331 RepID=A0ABU7E0Y6_9TELE|nr:hypothetical protein [Characodon lateralis]